EDILLLGHHIARAFRNNRTTDYIVWTFHYANTSSTFPTASFVMMSLSYPSTSSTLMPSAVTNFAFGRFLTDRATLLSYSAVTTRSFRSTFRLFRSAVISFVFGALIESASRT